MRFCSILVLALGFLAPAARAATPMDYGEIEDAITRLLSEMTLQEKLGQMSQRHYATGKDAVADAREAVRHGAVGSFLNVPDAVTVNALQRIAVEESRLKIPLLIGLDVIHGYRTIFPIPLAQSCSWNPELVERAARVAAIEASSAGVRWTFGPMLDIARDPRWGRVAETFGEDPHLTAQLGAAVIRGFQGENLADPQSLAACAKHYVGYGAVEGGRDYNAAQLSESELRNVHLRPFQAAVDAGVQTFMSAFTEINGVPASANPFTLKKILRDEWSFDGLVVSDWNAIAELVPHGFAADERAAARLALRAGVDMEMVSTTYRDHAEALLRDKKIDLATIDDAVRHILRVKFRLGLFANPYTDTTRPDILLSDDHLRVARELATQSMVLLKNENALLPLSDDLRTIALIGPLADGAADMNGCWSCSGKAEESHTVYSSFKDYVGPKTRVLRVPGLPSATSADTHDFPAAVEAAQKADVVVLCVGESRDLSGEARSRAFLNLPGAQEALIDVIAATGKPVILVVFAGRPLTFGRAAEKTKAILYAWHPGTMAGPAVCDLLFGRANPSGKLTTSFPRSEGQIPIYYNHKNTGRPAPADDGDVAAPLGTPQDPRGYFSKYLDVPSSPAYPFGHGLSYTTFAYSDLKVSGAKYDEALTVTASVANTGTRDGVEIVQLYTRQLSGSLTRPVKELRNFQRVELKAGEKRTITFALPVQSLGYFDNEGRYIVEPSKFHVWIGGSSQSGPRAEFSLYPP